MLFWFELLRFFATNLLIHYQGNILRIKAFNYNMF